MIKFLVFSTEVKNLKYCIVFNDTIGNMPVNRMFEAAATEIFIHNRKLIHLL